MVNLFNAFAVLPSLGVFNQVIKINRIFCNYSAFGIAIGLGRSRGLSSSPDKVKNFLLSTSSRLTLESSQPPIQWVPGALSSGVKRGGREADHSPPSSAKAKKMWIYKSTNPYVFTV
jgi:hypothetical protein